MNIVLTDQQIALLDFGLRAAHQQLDALAANINAQIAAQQQPQPAPQPAQDPASS